jgi:hypothetical protein
MLRKMTSAAVLVTLFVPWVALAQASSSPEAAASSSSSATTSRYVAGNWTYPSIGVMEHIRENGYSTGEVTIDCEIGPDGHLTTCDVVHAFPAGTEPAHSVAKAFLNYAAVDPASIPGGLRPGDHKKFTYKW